jgi:hypothetical protein
VNTLLERAMKRTGLKLCALSMCTLMGVAEAQPADPLCGSLVRVTKGTPAAPNTGGGNFADFITGATICAARGGDRWQEFHQAGGALIDWKRGSTDKVDPTKQVGTWASSNGANATVRHTYTPSGTFEWAICIASPGTYTLVSSAAGTVTGATIFAGQGACP